MVSDASSMRRPGLDRELGDPFARVLDLDRRDGQRFALSIALTLVLHAAGAARVLTMPANLSGFASDIKKAADVLRARAEIAIEPLPPPPPPPPEPEPEPPEPAPKAAPVEKVPTTAPAPAAQAGKVLMADPDPDEPVDLTGNTFVQGNAEAYAGGTTTSNGTSKKAVYDPHAAGAGPAIVGNGPPGPAKSDMSRPAVPLSGSWDHCGFPAEADIEQVNYARVSLAVTISADGNAQSASVVQDPGYGFGALAKRCALREHYQPARNHDGAAITFTQVITINFKR